MNESGYIRSVNTKLPDSVYAWKISDKFTAGVPDTWYSGKSGSIFIEYKFYQSLPKRKFTPKLSAQQILWLRERYDEGIPVAVIIGAMDGAFILVDLQWESAILVAEIERYKKPDVVHWIIKQVC